MKVAWLMVLLLLPGLVACGAAPPANERVGEVTRAEPTFTQAAVASATAPPATATLEPGLTPTDEPTEEPSPVPTTVPTPTPEPTPEPPASPTALPPATATTLVASDAVPDASAVLFVYQREGGFAGFCDTVTVQAEVAFWESCLRGSGKIDLSEADRQQLRQWVDQYAPFERVFQDNPGGSDNMTETLRFSGTGSAAVTPEVEAALRQFAGRLVNVGYGGQYP